MKKNRSIVYRLRTISLIFLISPIIIYWLLHGNYDRYIWIINSEPFSMLGGGPFQIWLYVLLLFLGVITGSVSIILHKKNESFIIIKYS